MSYLLGVDIGTLGTKLLLVDEAGVVHGSVAREHNVLHPFPGWAEHHPLEEWWQDFVELTRKLLYTTGIRGTDIIAIGIVGAFPSPCITTADGNPLRPAILYSDNRSEPLLYEINRMWDLELDGDDVTPRLLWILRHEPETFAQTGMILNAHSFIVYRLTGEYSIDFANATWFGGLYDYKAEGWDKEHCAELGIPNSILPPVYPADAVVGKIHSSAAQETGLAEGTAVIAGSGDMYLALLGSGAFNPGDVIIYYGTAGLFLQNTRPFMEVIGRPYIKQRERLANLIAYIQASGEIVRWESRLWHTRYGGQGGEKTNFIYEMLDEAAAQIAPGSEGIIVLPHFLGERSPGYRPQARGCIYGLTPDHNEAQLHRAILESFGFGIRHALVQSNFDQASISQVFACGGGAHSLLWRQIISDILGLKQIYHPKASSALGAAYLAGMGIGLFSNFETIRSVWLQGGQETQPSQENEAIYDPFFENYLDIYRAITTMMDSRATTRPERR